MVIYLSLEASGHYRGILGYTVTSAASRRMRHLEQCPELTSVWFSLLTLLTILFKFIR